MRNAEGSREILAGAEKLISAAGSEPQALKRG